MQNLPLLVSPEEFSTFISENIDTKDIRIIDLSNEINFHQGHIKGAIHFPYQALMLGQPPAPGKLPPKTRLIEIFSALGLNENTHFVVVDDEGGGWAGRFIWTLDVIGHKNYTYIDGGMIAWNQAGLKTENGSTKINFSPSEIKDLDIDTSPIASLEYIMDSLKEKNICIWDARSPEEYSGQKILAAKGGHIPGAISAEWTSLMNPENGYRIRKDAREHLEKLGIDGQKPIATHCQSHHRSGFTYLLGKILGFDIKAYDGSWSEWGNHPDTPVEI